MLENSFSLALVQILSKVKVESSRYSRICLFEEHHKLANFALCGEITRTNGEIIRYESNKLSMQRFHPSLEQVC